jgi:hypothetical protein
LNMHPPLLFAAKNPPGVFYFIWLNQFDNKRLIARIDSLKQS